MDHQVPGFRVRFWSFPGEFYPPPDAWFAVCRVMVSPADADRILDRDLAAGADRDDFMPVVDRHRADRADVPADATAEPPLFPGEDVFLDRLPLRQLRPLLRPPRDLGRPFPLRGLDGTDDLDLRDREQRIVDLGPGRAPTLRRL